MPLYDFKCHACEKISEFLVSNPADYSHLSCPDCGSHNLERLICAPSLVKVNARAPGTTCCGREERCETSPCSTGERCRRH